MLVGITPYYDPDKNTLFLNIEQGNLYIPDYITDDAKNLLRGLLQRDPKKRLGGGNRDAEEIKEHTFFKDIDFLRDAIKNRYKIINTGFRETAKGHVNKRIIVPQIIVPKIEDRTDLTNLFTISIDSSRKADVTNVLFDDAFSMNVDSMGNYILYIHIPDVDCYIPRKGEIEDFMRGLGESVYAKDMVTPLLSYSIASKCSLEHGKVKPALTYMIKIDPKGNVKDVAFFKSLVNVNYNMSCARANTFMISNSDERLNILNPMYELAAKLRRKRGERIGNRTKSYVIMDEFNIIADLAVAAYFNDQNIIFPYKNYKGKKSPVSQINIDQTEQFIRVNNISEEGRELINTIFDINNRVFYDTVNHGNTAYKGKPVGNVGNPMREYISLETDRLIKDLIIDKIGNEDDWKEKIERDCIEYTETSAKIKELYSMNKR
jgi:serine/threonine protein kinase